jgi:monovalent cation:H+ antiporter-2, CPA2 family
MHEVPLLVDITAALVVAFLGGMLARRLGLPTVVGYLLAGIVIGPFTPGFVGDLGTIRQLAELGVVFLLFGVGLHFSFADLWRVRDIAIPGALIQTALATLVGLALTRSWGWSLTSGLVLGLSVSVASTVVLLRGLTDRNLLNTPHGQAAIGWLVMEDLLSVAILVLMPTLVPGEDGVSWVDLATQLLKAAAFVALMLLLGRTGIPWLLERVAHTRSRELFILMVLVISLGTAVGAAALFGVSLALGAFAAGAVIGRSHLSHQVGADILVFREAFAVLFFVSIGMLVNPTFLIAHMTQVVAVTALIVVGKFLIVLLMGLFFARPARTFLVVGVGLSQIGEFSFILGQAGLTLGLLDSEQYALILAGALTSITVNPFLYDLLPWLERLLRRVPGLWQHLDAGRPIVQSGQDELSDHVVIVGFGRVGRHLVEVLDSLRVRFVVIESDVERIQALNERGAPALYGDAANSEIMVHAHLARARALVVTAPEDTTAQLIVTAARDLNPGLPIFARASTEAGVRQLSQAGARRVVHPELEGGLELVHHTLLSLGFPRRQVHEYAEAVREDHYEYHVDTDAEHRSLHDLLMASHGIEIVWLGLDPGCALVGTSLGQAAIRARTGASIVALTRGGKIVPNPKSSVVFEAHDRIGVIGEPEQIEAARALVTARA